MVQNAGEIPEGLTAHLLRGRPGWSIASFEGDYRPPEQRGMLFPTRIVAHGVSEARALARPAGDALTSIVERQDQECLRLLNVRTHASARDAHGEFRRRYGIAYADFMGRSASLDSILDFDDETDMLPAPDVNERPGAARANAPQSHPPGVATLCASGPQTGHPRASTANTDAAKVLENPSRRGKNSGEHKPTRQKFRRTQADAAKVLENKKPRSNPPAFCIRLFSKS